MDVNITVIPATPCYMACLLAALFHPVANAQQPGDVEVIEITGQQDTLSSLNPAAGQAEGLFGAGISVQDTPRTLTLISQAALEQFNIESLHDISRVAPNTYAASGFGTPSLPTVRGQLGELFQDGIRRQAGNNGFGLPFSFNSVEQVAVVKGPPTVLLGSTQRNGGFVNLRSKTAPVDEASGNLTLKAGRWDQYSGTLDYSTPIEQGKTAFRISAQWLDHGSFYDFAATQSENIFVTFRYQPDAVTTWDISAEFYDAEYPDIAGINRPTQALIDDGVYITGQGVQPSGSNIAGAGAIISPTGEVVIPRNRVLTHPDDINSAQTTILRSRYQTSLSPTLTWRNLSYYQYLEREEIGTNSFVEIIDGAHTAQNRTELDIQLTGTQRTTLALDVRYNDVLGYSQFTTEADNPIDLTGPLSNRLIPLSAAQQARLVALRPGVFVSPGAQYDINNDGAGDFNLSDTTDSQTWQTGVALQQFSQWSERLSTIVGVRTDYYDIQARDALSPPGVEAASDSYSDTLTSFQLNATYALTDSLNLFAAVGHNDATSNSMAGGTTLGADNQINPANFATENELYEIGLKYAPANNLYAEIAAFEQTRSLRNRDGSNTGVKTRGVELQAFWQADNYWVNGSYSYLDARFDNSAAFQGTRQVADAFDASRPDIISGTGVGSPSFAAFAPSDSRMQGVVPQLVSLNAGLDITQDISVGTGLVYTKSFPLDFLQTVHIRDQYRWDINASWQVSDNLRLRAEVVNLTDEENWQPVFEGGYFGATLVMPELPRHGQVTLQYAF